MSHWYIVANYTSIAIRLCRWFGFVYCTIFFGYKLL